MSNMTAKEWNDTYPISQPVCFTESDGSLTHTQTESKAYERGGKYFINLGNGRQYCSLDKIKPR